MFADLSVVPAGVSPATEETATLSAEVATRRTAGTDAAVARGTTAKQTLVAEINKPCIVAKGTEATETVDLGTVTRGTVYEWNQN